MEPSRSGGTGRRAGLKIRFPLGSVGSIPTFGTLDAGVRFPPSAPGMTHVGGRAEPRGTVRMVDTSSSAQSGQAIVLWAAARHGRARHRRRLLVPRPAQPPVGRGCRSARGRTRAARTHGERGCHGAVLRTEERLHPHGLRNPVLGRDRPERLDHDQGEGAVADLLHTASTSTATRSSAANPNSGEPNLGACVVTLRN